MYLFLQDIMWYAYSDVVLYYSFPPFCFLFLSLSLSPPLPPFLSASLVSLSPLSPSLIPPPALNLMPLLRRPPSTPVLYEPWM